MPKPAMSAKLPPTTLDKAKTMLLKAPNQTAEPPKVSTPIDFKSLEELDLPQELMAQYVVAKTLLEDVRHDEETPVNQKAQLLNTISSILATIVKTQAEVYSIERLKLLETTLISVLQKHEALREDFLRDYEKALAEL